MADGDEDERWMRRAIEGARSKGSYAASSPLGCVIVLGGWKIVAERNQTKKLPDATAHAEMMAIRRVCDGTGEVELRGRRSTPRCSRAACARWRRSGPRLAASFTAPVATTSIHGAAKPLVRLWSEC